MHKPPDEEVILWTEGVSRLTVEALDAAERGQWEKVEACYLERAKWFRHHHVSSNLAQALLAMDAAVMERAAAAHAAAGQSLAQMVVARKQWRSLSSVSVEGAPVGRHLSRRT